MVSIPDWTRAHRRLPVKDVVARTLLSSRERYDRALERQAVKEAERRGYFFTPTLLDIVNEFGRQKNRADCNSEADALLYVGSVASVVYSGRHLRAVGDLGMCSNLQVLKLDSNYLEDISPLCACRRLVMIDLHSNQISLLPDSDFWSQLQQLQIVLLHDNPINGVDLLHSLSYCPKLCGLTLYDTPLSLKKNYRHHVVNTIYSLKALDHHVISDEEIIEDAVFKGSRYAAMGPSFAINMGLVISPNSPPSEAVAAVSKIIAEINYIASRNCPVLVMQKFFRGWRIRRKRQPGHKRRVRGSGTRSPGKSAGHIAAKIHTMQNVLQPQGRSQRQHTTSPAASPTMPGNETMTKDQTSSSAKFSHANVAVDVLRLQESLEKTLAQDQDKKKRGDESRVDGLPKVDMSGYVTAVHGSGDAGGRHAALVRPLVPDASLHGRDDGTGSEDELAVCRFRLHGYRTVIHRVVPVEQTIIARRDAGHDLRDMVADAHERLAVVPRPTIVKSNARVKDKFMFTRLHDTMSLSCLHAVHQAYADRQLEESAAYRTEATAELRQLRDAARASVRAFAEDRRLAVLKQRDAEKKSLLEADEKQQLEALHGQNTISERKQRALRKRSFIKAEQAFVNDFRTQQTSVSKALLRHDWQSKKDGAFSERCQTVVSAKDSQKEKQHIIKRFLEHRSRVRQTENSVTKAAIDSRILQRVSDHLEEVRSRVNVARSTKHQPPLPYALPNVTVSIPSVPSVPNATPDWRSDFRSAAESRGGIASDSIRIDRSSKLYAPA